MHTEATHAESADLAGLAALVAAELPHGWDEAALAAELARPDARVWVVHEAGCVSGGAIARSTGLEVELMWIAVVPASRRRGVARCLVEAVLAWARADRASVSLEVRASNAAAAALYAEAGFVVVGRRPRYYRDGEDAVLLACAPPLEAES